MKSKIRFIICLLYGLIFINAGLNFFFGYMPPPNHLPDKMQKMNAAFMGIGWILPLVACVQIVGGVLFIIPRLRFIGAIMLFPVLIGILLTHLSAAPEGLPLVLILLGINLWIMYEHREKLRLMIK